MCFNREKSDWYYYRIKSDSPINEHVKKHGDGVKILALWVDDAYAAFEETTKRGGKPYLEPVTLTDEQW
jgi:4-hydroxyphenylpyruvate dioxygenase